jgi:hypothetical protein
MAPRVTAATANGEGGTVFRLTSNGDGTLTESVLWNFTNGFDGGGPICTLLLDTPWQSIWHDA